MSFLLLVCAVSLTPAPMPPDVEKASWSRPTNGLQARVVLEERPKFNGTRQLIPYLELRNVTDQAAALKVRCDSGHVKFELIGVDGQAVRDGATMVRSGPHADPGTARLPHDSSMRIGMYCSNWGVPKDAAAMISTDTGAWVLQQKEKGIVFLRVTVKGAKVETDDRIWHGEIQATVKVDWKE